MEYRYHAIIIHKRDLAEFDRMYALYTFEAGKIKVIGKGTRRLDAKLAGHLEPVTYSEVFVAKGKGLGRISGAIAAENFLHIKSNLECIQKIFHVFHVLEKSLGEEQKDERMFLLLLQFLKSMDKASEKKYPDSTLDVITLGFLFKFLSESGYALEVERCVRCGTRLEETHNAFSLSRGGILCRQCRSYDAASLNIHGNAIKLIRIFLHNKIENLAKLQVSPRELAQLSRITREFIHWIIG